MAYNILVINPGSTSTKIAFYKDENKIMGKTVDHKIEDLEKFDDIMDQLEYRLSIVEETIKEWKLCAEDFDAIIGRGGLLPGVKSGGYLVTDSMIKTLKNGKASPHASNLGALLADKIGGQLKIPTYIYDCVTADEFEDIAKITGMPDVKRESMCHVLNMKAVSRKLAKELGTTYEKLNLIVAHLGGGISIGVHSGGKIIDCIRDDAGPFSPERAGGIPLLYMIDICYSGIYSKKEMIKRIRGLGGLKAYLGTQDCREIEDMIKSGNEEAKKLYEAQAYQIAKGIGELAPVVNGKINYIILTGGMAYSEMMTKMIKERVEFLAPIRVIPGENEMESLALAALRMLNGEDCKIYEPV